MRAALSGSCFLIASMIGPGTSKASSSRISLATSSARRATSGTGIVAGAASCVGADAGPDGVARLAGAEPDGAPLPGGGGSPSAAAGTSKAATVMRATGNEGKRRNGMPMKDHSGTAVRILDKGPIEAACSCR